VYGACGKLFNTLKYKISTFSLRYVQIKENMQTIRTSNNNVAAIVWVSFYGVNLDETPVWTGLYNKLCFSKQHVLTSNRNKHRITCYLYIFVYVHTISLIYRLNVVALDYKIVLDYRIVYNTKWTKMLFFILSLANGV